jgi:hypothetical protein
VIDFDGDGWPDLFCAARLPTAHGARPSCPDSLPSTPVATTTRNLLFRNTSKGFVEIGMDAGVAYNGDGRSISAWVQTSATSMEMDVSTKLAMRLMRNPEMPQKLRLAR